MGVKTIKELFIEYYLIHDEQKKKELIETATIVLDTNVLLNLYKWSKDTASEFLKVLEQIEERIWIPYQVLYEFFQNRLNVIEEKRNELNGIIKGIDEIIEKLEKQREFKGYKFKEDLAKIREFISNKVEQVLSDKNNDWILEKITNLFEGKHGQPFSEEQYKEIIEEGKNRYRQKIPPGYKDQDKDINTRYGDLLIWKEIILYAKENKRNVIFITNDQKEDWWWRLKRDQKRKISPRPELIREFYNETGQLFWIYTSGRFLEIIKSILRVSNEEALKEAIKEIKESEREEDIYYFHWDWSKPPRSYGEYSIMQPYKGLLKELLQKYIGQVPLQSQQSEWLKQICNSISLEKLSEQLKIPIEAKTTDEAEEDH